MNALVPDPNRVRISAAPHPLRSATVDREVPEGLTIADMLAEVQADPILRRHAHIFIDDWYVSRETWHLVRPKAGHLVTVRIVPQGGGGGGGGKDIFRVILSIGVIAASIFAGPLLGAAIAPGLTAGTQAALGTAIIGIGGSLLVNVIAPVRPPSLGGVGSRNQNEAESPSYFLDQARNQFRPYAPVPVIFGKHRVVPPLGAAPVTEVVGDANHLRMIVVWGYGPLRITDIKIGETPIGNFEDVRIETREGRSGDDPITIYPNDIDQQNFSVSLAAGAWNSRRSAANADELSIDIVLPRGLAEYDERTGKRGSRTVAFEVQYKSVDDAGWTNLTRAAVTSATMGESKISGGTVTLTGARSQPIRHGIRWDVTRGQYDVRVRRTTADNTNERVFDSLAWSALRTITDQPPIDFPENLAVTAIDIRASDQLSGAVEDLNGIVEAESLAWNGTAWSAQYSRSPASAFRLALQSPARRQKEVDNNINLEALQDWSELCSTNGYNFDHIQDTRSGLWEVLSNICAAGRASPTRVDGKWSVVVDTGTQQVVQHFSPVNSANFKVRRAFDNPPDGFRISFPNEDANWSRDERIVYNDGFDDTNAQFVPSLSPVGITNRDHVYKFGRFQLAQALLRREVWECEANMQYLVARRGSRITAQHDVLAVGLASAYVESVETNSDGDVTAAVLDTAIQLPKADQAYGAKVRTRANAHIVSPITQTGGPDTDAIDRVDFVTPIEGLRAGDIVTIGESGRETIDGLVTAVRPGRDLMARVLAVPYQAGIYNAETGAIPAFDSKISLPADLDERLKLTMTIVAVISDRSASRIVGNVRLPGIRVEIRPIPVTGVTAEPEIRPSGTDEPYRPAEVRAVARDSCELGDVETGSSYDVRLRWVTQEGTPGPWDEVEGHTVAGLAPPAPTGLAVAEGVGGIREVSCVPPDIPDLSGVRVRYANNTTTAWDAMSSLGEGKPITTFPYLATVPGAGTWTFEARSEATDGSQSTGVRVTETLTRVEPGIDGTDGEAGIGVEYIFTNSADGAPITDAGDLPLSTWHYDAAGLATGITRGSYTYYDGQPPTSAARPYIIRFRRAVSGSPAADQNIGTVPWTQETAVFVRGRDGAAGAPGADGEDGEGVEYIFTSSATGDPVTGEANLPLATQHYDVPALRTDDGLTRGNQSYYDGLPPDLSNTRPYYIRFQRAVPGSPAIDADIGSRAWRQDAPVKAFGQDGTDGRAGNDGEEGVGVEYIFTSKADADAITAAADLPLATWNYDAPGLADGITRGAQTYFDGTPTDLSDSKAYSIRFRRAVPGSPAADEDIGSVEWTQEHAIKVVGEDGGDGRAGNDGQDGSGVEYIFTAKADDTAISGDANLPLATWNYDAAGLANGITRGTQTYFDGTPTDLSDTKPYSFRFRRPVAGSPAPDSDIGAVAWTQEHPIKVIGEDGAAGLDGNEGAPGESGLGLEYIFAVHNYETLPPSLYPLDSWGFDQPGEAGGIVDRSERRNQWSAPAIYRYQSESAPSSIIVRYARASVEPDQPPDDDSDTTPTVTIGGSGQGRSWSSNVPAGTDPLYFMVGVRENGAAGYLWEPPVAILGSVAVRTLYQQSGSTPDTPTTGGYAGGTWTDPTGWATNVPGGTAQDVWATVGVAETENWPQGFGERRRLIWYDGKNTGLPDPSEDDPYLSTSRRETVGTPAVGAAVPAPWTVPNTYRAFGVKGDKGDPGPRVWSLLSEKPFTLGTTGTSLAIEVPDLTSYSSIFVIAVEQASDHKYILEFSFSVANLPTTNPGESNFSINEYAAHIIIYRDGNVLHFIADDGQSSWFKFNEIWGLNNPDDTATIPDTSLQRDSSRDIDLGEGFWEGAASDGTTLWFIDNKLDNAIAYVAATRARDSAKDISLGSNIWSSATCDGTTLWVMDRDPHVANREVARAWTASTRARDSSKDITFPSGVSVSNLINDGTTLWGFTNGLTYAYTIATKARDTSKEFSLSATGTVAFTGGTYDGTTLWFLNTTMGAALAYNASTLVRDSRKDIYMGPAISRWDDGVFAAGTFWAVDRDTSDPGTAIARAFD